MAPARHSRNEKHQCRDSTQHADDLSIDGFGIGSRVGVAGGVDGLSVEPEDGDGEDEL